MKKYFKYWLKNSFLSLQSDLATRTATIFFIFGKILRFYFFLIFLFVILGRQGGFRNYSSSDLLTFFLVFNLFDIVGQVLFRGIYWFREKIITGSFDLILIKPINPIFAALTDKTDFLDLPLLVIIFYLLVKQSLLIPAANYWLFLLVSFAGLGLVTSIHIFVACLGILTTEVDHAIWIYRDLSSMARFPVDIYAPILRYFLIFVIPIGVIYTFPTQAFMGILSTQLVVYSVLISVVIFWLSLKLWDYCLKKYSGASS